MHMSAANGVNEKEKAKHGGDDSKAERATKMIYLLNRRTSSQIVVCRREVELQVGRETASDFRAEIAAAKTRYR